MQCTVECYNAYVSSCLTGCPCAERLQQNRGEMGEVDEPITEPEIDPDRTEPPSPVMTPPPTPPPRFGSTVDDLVGILNHFPETKLGCPVDNLKYHTTYSAYDMPHLDIKHYF